MSKRLLSAALIAGLGLAFGPGANAADGTITFNGRVLAKSCVIQNSGSIDVDLPWVYTTALANAGDTTGDTDFSISISGCDTALTSAQAFFSGTSINDSTNRLTLDAGGASGVEIELLNGNGDPVLLGQSSAALQESQVFPMTNGGATLEYTARYVATGSVSPGAANSSVQFTMIYE